MIYFYVLNIHISYVDAKYFFKRRDLNFTGKYPFFTFGNLILIVGYIKIYWVDGVRGYEGLPLL